MQGFVTIILIVYLILTTWWFVLPQLGKYLRMVFTLCMILISIFSVSSFLYWMCQPIVSGYFQHRAPAVVERYLESATSAAFWPVLFVVLLIACLALIEGIRYRAFISHLIQDIMVWLGNL